MSGLHIAHATATFAELGLALSVGMLAKIIPRATSTDAVARTTTANRVASEDGNFVAFFYKVALALADLGRSLFDLTPAFCGFLAIASLLGLAFCPSVNKIAHLAQFGFSAFSFLLIGFYIYLNRQTLAKTGESPDISPHH